MTEYATEAHLKRLEDALDIAYKTTVPKRKLDDALGALRRCQELLGRLAATIEDLDVRHAHSDLMFEAKLYANVLAGFFDDAKSDWYDLAKGYNPRDYLTDKGAIKSTNPTRVQMEERFVAERKAKKDEIDRLLSDLEWKRAKRKLKQAQRNIGEVVKPVIEVGPAHEYINKLRAEHGRGPIKPASKRGRPAGSKNKPKTGIVSKVNAILKANKKGSSK